MYGLPLQPVCKSSSSIQSVHTLYPQYSKPSFGLVLQYLSKDSLFFKHYDKNMLFASRRSISRKTLPRSFSFIRRPHWLCHASDTFTARPLSSVQLILRSKCIVVEKDTTKQCTDKEKELIVAMHCGKKEPNSVAICVNCRLSSVTQA